MLYESNGDIVNNEKMIIEFLENNNGYISTSDFLNLNISKPMINKFIDLGLIRKVSHGLYISNELVEDEYYIIQKKYSFAIFSYNTAFHILNMTNRTPYEIDITVPRGKTIRGDYNVHYVTENYYDIGIIETLSPCGNVVRIYNAERSICDMLRSDTEFDLELQNRILNYYFESENRNVDKLLEYAKIFNIYDKVNTIVEVMMKW